MDDDQANPDGKRVRVLSDSMGRGQSGLGKITDSVIQTILEHKNLQNGFIILCHNGAKYTADALESVIRGLKEKGYEIVPISELIYRENYHMDPAGRQISDER